MKLYNSASHTREDFVPHTPGKVSMYTCGPTVYHFAHIGNLRSYLMEDVLEKFLRYDGYDVTRVMNITDVGHLSSDADTGEDKMLKGAQREHKTVMEIAQFYTDAFFADCKKLNIKYPDVVQPATGMIDSYIKVITKLMDTGYAYFAGGKMSKSKGEFTTVSTLEEKGYDPLVYRLFCLQSHYRKALVFTYENLDNAKAAYEKLVGRVAALKTEGTADEAAMAKYDEAFKEALGNDLNTSLAVTRLYDVLKAKDLSDADKLALVGKFDQVLGLDLLKKAEAKRAEQAKATTTASAGGYTVTGEGDAEIDALVLRRGEAKKAKNFAEADAIRDELKAKGIEVTDVPGGAVWKRI